MDYMDYIRYASFALNGVALILWLKSKFILTEFLQGSWKGNLEVKEDVNHIIECTLIVVCHKDRDNSALLYYERKRLACGTVITRGVDKLEKYPDNLWFFWDGS